MNKWQNITKHDGKEYRQIDIFGKSEWSTFDLMANKLLIHLSAILINKLDGLDERYWDFDLNGNVITLHLQHHLGIVLFYENNNGNEPNLYIEDIILHLLNMKSAQQGDAPEPATNAVSASQPSIPPAR